MTAGSPRVHNAAARTAADTQAASIRAMATRGVPLPQIAAAHGCTLARIQQVLATPPGHTPPTPNPTRVHRDRARTASIPHLLELLAAHDDPRLARLGAHITADLDTARDLLAAEDSRAAAAALLIAADLSAASTWATHDTAHRRRTDHQEAP